MAVGDFCFQMSDIYSFSVHLLSCNEAGCLTGGCRGHVVGHLDIICLEDVVHQVVTVGPHFKDVNTFLLLFRLNPPAGGWKKRSRLFADGGECGPRGNEINALLRRMI